MRRVGRMVTSPREPLPTWIQNCQITSLCARYISEKAMMSKNRTLYYERKESWTCASCSTARTGFSTSASGSPMQLSIWLRSTPIKYIKKTRIYMLILIIQRINLSITFIKTIYSSKRNQRPLGPTSSTSLPYSRLMVQILSKTSWARESVWLAKVKVDKRNLFSKNKHSPGASLPTYKPLKDLTSNFRYFLSGKFNIKKTLKLV